MPAGAYVVVTPLSTTVANVTRAWRLGAVMFSAFGALAALVAAVGLYGVVSYGVNQRGHEIGIRMALGARVFDVVRLVVGEALTITILGVAIGCAVAWLVAPRIGPLLFGVSSHDARSYVGACCRVAGRDACGGAGSRRSRGALRSGHRAAHRLIARRETSGHVVESFHLAERRRGKRGRSRLSPLPPSRFPLPYFLITSSETCWLPSAAPALVSAID